MSLFKFSRKGQWVSYADWQREVYAKTIREVMNGHVIGQPVKTSANAASFTLRLYVNPEHPQADDYSTLVMRPAEEGSIEFVLGGQRDQLFRMPKAPDEMCSSSRPE